MRFLFDVHIARSIGRVLTAQGHDVLYASDAHAEWPDARLLVLAVDDDRVLVTEDRDFSDLIYQKGATPPRAVLYLRCGPSVQPDLADRVLLVLANAEIDGHMVVIQRSNIRYRPLPEKSRDNG